MADDECGCRNGQREVTDVWARQEAGIARDADLVELERAARLAGEQQRMHSLHPTDPNYPAPDPTPIEQWGKYRAALNTVFPCPTCRPKQFARWRHGCFGPNHVAKRCRYCKDDTK